MKAISFKDVLLCEGFENLNEFDLLPVEMDKQVLPILFQLGIDTNKGYEIIASKHRTLTDKVSVGYRYYGSVRIDKAFQKSLFCTTEDRIAAAGVTDPSLALDMCASMNATLNYGSFSEDGELEELPSGHAKLLYVEGHEAATDELSALQAICYSVRGDPYGAGGSLKTHAEWLETNAVTKDNKF
jgi:hypothetical protein